jgi:CubicO group peptidase (beta-lactamase class C family)
VKPSLPDQFDKAFARSGLVAAGFGIKQGHGPAQVFVGGTVARNSRQSVPTDAAWHIGSITKTFTAALVMMAVEQGTLSLDTPLRDVLPDQADRMTADWQSLTLTEILSHTGGIPANPDRAQIRALAQGDMDQSALLEAYWAQPLLAKRGRFAYSNIGYILVAQILEQRVGASWETQLRDKIAAPLGLSSLGIGPPPLVLGHRSLLGWFKRPAPADGPASDNPPVFTPAGRLHMSLADLLTWGRFLLSAQQGKSDLLSAESLSRMTREIDKSYGLGLFTFAIPKVTDTAFGHDGSNTMWYALLAIMPDQDTVVCVIANEARPAKVTHLGVTMAAAALGQ